MRYLFLVAMFTVVAIAAQAQPRPVDRSATIPDNAPDVFSARYEGGLFGNGAKEKGTLKIDDANERLLFFRPGEQKEMFEIPYAALVVIYPDSKESVPQSGKVIQALPIPGAGLAGLMSKSVKYANLSFDDPDIEAKGSASFRFDTKEQLLLFISKLGTKAKMAQRGDAYYRRKKPQDVF
jgi:hypothetical protein